MSMQIGIAQINTTVGDLSGNSQLIIDAYRSLVNEGAQIVVFPELSNIKILSKLTLEPSFPSSLFT